MVKKSRKIGLGALTGLESYGKLIGALLVLHKLEDWRNESPEQNHRVFQRIAFQVLDELDFDHAVSAELPGEPYFQTPLRERMLADRRCVLNALVALYKGRETALPRNVKRLFREQQPALAVRGLEHHRRSREPAKMAKAGSRVGRKR